VRLEGLGQLKKKMHFIGTRNRALPACSIVLQSTTLPRAPFKAVNILTGRNLLTLNDVGILSFYSRN
jgi:hypothetical protein